MLDALNITEEEALGLAEIARHDLALARDFARRALAAEDNDEANRLGRSYQRAARSYRQTLAVKARLMRDLAATAQVQARTPPVKPGGAAVARRLGEVRSALTRLAWAEAERPETDEIEAEAPEVAAEAFACAQRAVETALTLDTMTDSFGDEPLDDHVARLALGLRFEPALITGWRDLPDPPDWALDIDAGDLEWRSSA